MRLVQCEGYKPDGQRCRYHGMADVSDGMFCEHHKRQSRWDLYRVHCLCASCSSSVDFYFAERGVRFYCQWHKNMAHEDSETDEEEEETEEEESSEEEAAPPPRQRPRQLVPEGVDIYGNVNGNAYPSSAYNGGAYSGGRDIQRFADMRISGPVYDDSSDDSGGGRGGRTVYVRNMQVNNHYHIHRHERRDDCTIQ